MAKNFTYKKTETTALKAVGIIDSDRMVVDVDGEEKSLATLFADFNGACVEINIKTKTKNEEELDEPTSTEE